MRPNRFRALLNANQPTVGTHLLSTWPTLVELVGQAGNYDYVEFTAEYSPFDMHDLDNLGRALELKDLAGMIKVEQTQWTHQAMRAIGSGFQSVLFADVRTVEDARACVGFCLTHVDPWSSTRESSCSVPVVTCFPMRRLSLLPAITNVPR